MTTESNAMGKMRTANLTMGQALMAMDDLREDQDAMLSPAKSAELKKIVREMYESLQQISITVNQFDGVARSRADFAHHE